MKIFKFKKTIFGALFLLALVVISFLYSIYGPEVHEQKMLIYDKQGNVIGVPPLKPSKDFPLGTDLDGRNILYLLVDGMKYTIIIAVGVSIIRVLIGTVIGLFISVWIPKVKPFFKAFFLPFQYVPSILLAILLMAPIASGFTAVPVMSKITFQAIILIFMGIPMVLFFITDFVAEIKKKAFITASYLMGASHFHVLIKQILPNLRSHVVLLTVQQLLQTLQVMMYLGIFSIYFGGQSMDPIMGTNPVKYKSITSELAGLNGQNYWSLNWAPWVVLTSILGIFLLIVIVNSMKKELEDHIEGRVKVRKIRRKIASSKDSSSDEEFVKDQFSFLDNNPAKTQPSRRTAALSPLNGKAGSKKNLKGVISLLGILILSVFCYQLASGSQERQQTKTAVMPKEEKVNENLVETGTATFEKSKARKVDLNTPLSAIKDIKTDTIKNQNHASYKIDLKMNKKGEFNVTADILVSNLSQDKWEDIIFQFNPNAFTKENKPEFMEGTGKLSVKSIKINDVPTKYKLDKDVLQLLPNSSIGPNNKVSVSIDYSFVLPEKSFRFSQDNGNYYLAQWYPILSPYHSGWDKEELFLMGESYHSDFSEFVVEYEVPKGYHVISSADVEPNKPKEKGTLMMNNIKEFYMAVLKDMKMMSKKSDGVEIRVFSYEYSYLKDSLETARKSLSSFEKNIGDYPHQQLDVIMDGGGMEYPGIVTVGSEGVDEFVIAHEIAHQWFYGMVNNHPQRTPWIDESLTNYATYLYFLDERGYYPEAAFQRAYRTIDHAKEQGIDLPTNLSLNQYKDKMIGYAAYVYERPSLEYWRLSSKNAKKGYQFLSTYFNLYKFKEVDEQEWLRFTRSYFKIEDAKDINKKSEWYKLIK